MTPFEQGDRGPDKAFVSDDFQGNRSASAEEPPNRSPFPVPRSPFSGTRSPIPDPLHVYTPANERGEWRPFEFSFRAGLLGGAILFFQESLGFPWQRNLFGVAGALVALLAVMTLVFGWRVLGDWRRRTNQVLYVLLIAALALPMAAALSPGLGASAIPNPIEQPIVEFLAALKSVPGAGVVLRFVQGMLSFLFLALTLVVLLLGSQDGRRGGLVLVAACMVGVCLFFYPSAETVVGFLFLGIFFANQWEVPVLVPDRLRPHLSALQMDYLRDLVREGQLSTGETRLYLDNDAAQFAELAECQLVEYDTITRSVYPGARLLHDPTSRYLESAVNLSRRAIWLAIGLLYVALPDLIPGPIDDAVIMLLCTASGVGLFSGMRRDRGRGGMSR